jgi:thioredoxin 1
MKELLFFEIPSCPHCKLAVRFLKELYQEDPRYEAVSVRVIDETKEKALADSYDYWYVPCFFLDGQKLHEGHAEKADIRAVLERCLA